MSGDGAWVQIGGIVIQHPVTAGTNALLAAQCAAYFSILRASQNIRARLWGRFFLMMSVATFAGVFKHGVRHLLGEEVLVVVLAASNLGGGVSTYFAQRATIVSCASASCRAGWRRLVGAQLAAFLVANVVLGPELILLILNSAVGLLPVIIHEALHARDVRGSHLVSTGLALSILTGVVYLAGLSAGAWFNHIDIAHSVMLVSFVLVYRGARQDGAPWT
jgi:hypothetical protein